MNNHDHNHLVLKIPNYFAPKMRYMRGRRNILWEIKIFIFKITSDITKTNV